MTTKERQIALIRKAEQVARLTVKMWSPGDGKTRYRFFKSFNEDYENWGASIYTALGIKEAYTWLNGYIDGQFNAR